MPSTTLVPSPLRSQGFTRLSPTTYLYQPLITIPRTGTSPDTIIFLAWAAAPPKLISKYTISYQTIYPESRILLVTTSFSDLILHTRNSQAAPLASALALLRPFSSQQNDPRPRHLIHLLSNGGSYKLHELAAHYRRLTNSILPIDALILDSAPGRPHFRNAAHALLTTLPSTSPNPNPTSAPLLPLLHYLLRLLLRALGTIAVYFYLGLYYAWRAVARARPITQLVWEALNDGALVDPGAERLYVYSKADDMVDWRDVVVHGEGFAASRGELGGGKDGVDGPVTASSVKLVDGGGPWRVSKVGAQHAMSRKSKVRREEFVGTRHVAHVVGDPKRYWRAVREVWDGAVAAREREREGR